MKTLYLGLEAPQHPSIVHCPLIQIVPLHTPEVSAAFAQLARYTHILFTSKSAVKLFCERISFNGIVYSIGDATTRHLVERGMTPYKTAVDASSEGIVELLQGEALENGHLFWPHSARSRSLIIDHLKRRGIAFTDCHLYDTLPLKPDPLPNLHEFDKVVFTSPSTVEAFFNLFDALPSHIHVEVIGPITAQAFKNRLVSDEQNPRSLFQPLWDLA